MAIIRNREWKNSPRKIANFREKPLFKKMLGLWQKNLDQLTQKRLLPKGGETMTEEKQTKNYSAIVKMKDGDTHYCTKVVRSGDDVTLEGQYKDGKEWKITTSKDQISSIKEDKE